MRNKQHCDFPVSHLTTDFPSGPRKCLALRKEGRFSKEMKDSGKWDHRSMCELILGWLACLLRLLTQFTGRVLQLWSERTRKKIAPLSCLRTSVNISWEEDFSVWVKQLGSSSSRYPTQSSWNAKWWVKACSSLGWEKSGKSGDRLWKDAG